MAEGEGWDTLRTVDALIAKAGHRGDVTPQLRDGLGVTRYQVGPAHFYTPSLPSPAVFPKISYS